MSRLRSRYARGFTASALLIVGALMIGCAGDPANIPPPATGGTSQTTSAKPSDNGTDEASAEVLDHHRHHHGGVTKFIAMSLDTIGVTPEQKANIDKIQADLRAKLAPGRDAEKNVVAIIADGLAAGNIDQAKVDTAIAQVATASAGVHAASADAINQLHNVLTPEQRAALVDKVDAHWTVWKEANGQAEDAPQLHTHLDRLTEELSLTPDQVQKIQASLQASNNDAAHRFDVKEVEAHIQAFRTAFLGDSFDAKTLSGGENASVHLAGFGAMHMAKFYEAVGPALTADQRTKLADHLREHANHKDSTGTAGA